MTVLTFPQKEKQSEDVVVWQCPCGSQTFYILQTPMEIQCSECDGVIVWDK